MLLLGGRLQGEVIKCDKIRVCEGSSEVDMARVRDESGGWERLSGAAVAGVTREVVGSNAGDIGIDRFSRAEIGGELILS